jgi:VIT1/CCC1 family predicted Fe2+/Mn2+ transporter
VIALNILLLGLLASSFARGPYSSWGQEAWYRYGSLSFLLFGAILPALALASGARRSRRLVVALTVWMLTALFFCFYYALMSGGGV